MIRDIPWIQQKVCWASGSTRPRTPGQPGAMAPPSLPRGDGLSQLLADPLPVTGSSHLLRERWTCSLPHPPFPGEPWMGVRFGAHAYSLQISGLVVIDPQGEASLPRWWGEKRVTEEHRRGSCCPRTRTVGSFPHNRLPCEELRTPVAQGQLPAVTGLSGVRLCCPGLNSARPGLATPPPEKTMSSKHVTSLKPCELQCRNWGRVWYTTETPEWPDTCLQMQIQTRKKGLDCTIHIVPPSRGLASK